MDQLTEEDDIETGKRVFECFLDYITFKQSISKLKETRF